MNLSPDVKRRLLSSAEELAADLARGGATRGEWRHVIDALYLAPGDPVRKPDTACEVIEALPESWLIGRSRQTERQLIQVRTTFRRILQHGYSDSELRFLVGWTTRILDAQEKERKREARFGPGPRRQHLDRPPRPPKDRPRASRPTEPAVHTPKGPTREIWRQATVTYVAGGGGLLRAVTADRRSAEARQDDARKLLEVLGQNTRTKLVEKKRPLQMEVEVEKIGTSWHLAELREAR
jgi:hypothetical protein